MNGETAERRDRVERYLLGVMNAEEAERLEAGLGADDALLSELVETACENTRLREALCACRDQIAIETPRRKWRLARSTQVGLAAAAGLLIAVGVWRSVEWRPARNAAHSVAGRVSSVEGNEWSVVARVALKQNEVRFRAGVGREAGWKEMMVGDEVREGMRIETGEGGRVKLAYVGEATTVEIGERSTLNVQPSFAKASEGMRPTSKGGKSLFLDRGRLTAVVAKQEPGKPFAVQTPEAEVEVVGTKFSVGAGEGKTRLDVAEGVVRAKSATGGCWVNVRGGGQMTAETGLPIEVTRAFRIVRELRLPEEIRGAEGVADDGTLLWVTGSGWKDVCALDPNTGELVRRVAVGGTLRKVGKSLAYGAGCLWVDGWSERGRALYRIRLPNGETEWVRSFRAPDGMDETKDLRIAYGDGRLWVNEPGREPRCMFWQLDPATGEIRGQFASQYWDWRPLWLDGSLWVFNSGGAQAARIDPNDGKELVRAQGVPWSGRGSLEPSETDPAGGFWVLNPQFGRLMRVEALFVGGRKPGDGK